jgi:hypothetical protein
MGCLEKRGSSIVLWTFNRKLIGKLISTLSGPIVPRGAGKSREKEANSPCPYRKLNPHRSVRPSVEISEQNPPLKQREAAEILEIQRADKRIATISAFADFSL